MTRDNLIENVIFSYLLGAACYCAGTLVYFFWKQWSEIKKTKNISEEQLDIRSHYKTKMMSRAVMLIAIIYLTIGAIFGKFDILILLLSLGVSYYAIKGFSNIFGDFLTYDNIDKIEVCNLYLRPFDVDSTSTGLKIERYISKYFSEYAHVFSIGNPATILPSLGTTSIFATDDKWKETVSVLMERAKMIVIRIGETEGTSWELERCISLGYQSKSIFIVDGKRQYSILLGKINDISLFVNELYVDKLAAIFYNHRLCKWECLSLCNKSDVRHLFDSVIESFGYNEEINEIRHKRLYFWKYIFSKENYPEKMKPFSLGYLLNCIVYIFYNRWHPAIMIYYALGVVLAQYVLRPYIYDSLYFSLPAFFIWLSLLLVSIVTLVYAPQISWLSQRWPSYEYFKEDNSQLNKILWGFWKIVIIYDICIYFLTYILIGHPYYIGT